MSLPKLAIIALNVGLLALGCGGASGGTEGPATDSAPIGDGKVLPDSASGIDSGLGDATVGEDVGEDTSVVPGDVGTDGKTDTLAETPPIEWPKCDTKPLDALATDVASVFKVSGAKPAYSWLSKVVVTAISGGACTSGAFCQVFLQEPGFTTLDAAARHAIKLFISDKGAERFVDLKVGDELDVAAWGLRSALDGQNEIMLQVNDGYRGCAKVTGKGTIAPVKATVPQLASTKAYEETYGPVLVTVDGITGIPKSANNLFALWTTGTKDLPGVTLSMTCLPGGLFDVSATSVLKLGVFNDFKAITGVFGLFVGTASGGTVTKIPTLYPRQMAEITK